MTKKGVSALETHLGYWLRIVSNHVSYAFSHKLQREDVTVAEWVLMRQLYAHPDAAPSDLADVLDMTRGAISKLAERLVAKALVKRTFDSVDLRRQSLTLTVKGRALVPRLAALADANDREFFGDLDPEVRRTLMAAMKDIVRRKGLKAPPVD